jgi:hypothetical protein
MSEHEAKIRPGRGLHLTGGFGKSADILGACFGACFVWNLMLFHATQCED